MFLLVQHIQKRNFFVLARHAVAMYSILLLDAYVFTVHQKNFEKKKRNKTKRNIVSRKDCMFHLIMHTQLIETQAAKWTKS